MRFQSKLLPNRSNDLNLLRPSGGNILGKSYKNACVNPSKQVSPGFFAWPIDVSIIKYKGLAEQPAVILLHGTDLSLCLNILRHPQQNQISPNKGQG